MNAFVLLADRQPEPAICAALAAEGYAVQAFDCDEALVQALSLGGSGLLVVGWPAGDAWLGRPDHHRPDLAVIALLPADDPAAAERALAVGVDDWLIAPLDPTQLRLRARMSRRQRAMAAGQAGAVPAEILEAALSTELVPLVVTRLDDGTVLYANARLGEVVGVPVADLIGRQSAVFYDDPADRKALQAGILRDGSVQDFIARGRLGNGRAVWFSVSVRLARLKGLPVAVSTITDITARREAELALAASEQRYRTLTESTAVGIWQIKLDGSLVYANRAMLDLLELDDMPSLAARTYRDFFTPAGIKITEEQHRLRAQGQGATFEVELVGAKGTHRHVIITGVPQRGPDGSVHSTIGTFVDVTELKRLKARLILADRLASLGTLAAGMAHEINNPLTFVMGNIDLALETMNGGGPAAARAGSFLARALEGSERIRAIVDDLNAYSRPQETDDGPIAIHRVLDSAIEMALHQLRLRARLDKVYGEILPVRGSASRLHQVFLNLLVNAAQAIPEGAPERHRVTVRTSSRPGWVVVEIADTGVGMPLEHQERLFEPFFTTKALGRGTGLGLPICHSIVTGLGGEIQVESASGEGCLIRVLLPAVDAPAAAEATPPPPVSGDSRNARLLVVDDEPQILELIREVLGDQHEVVTVARATEALVRLEREAFDLVLCDLMMPELSGMDFYLTLRQRLPQTAGRVVFLTAGTYTDRAKAFLAQVPNARLAKPFTLEALAETVQAALAAVPPLDRRQQPADQGQGEKG